LVVPLRMVCGSNCKQPCFIQVPCYKILHTTWCDRYLQNSISINTPKKTSRISSSSQIPVKGFIKSATLSITILPFGWRIFPYVYLITFTHSPNAASVKILYSIKNTLPSIWTSTYHVDSIVPEEPLQTKNLVLPIISSIALLT
jgi:hypothetical protein